MFRRIVKLLLFLTILHTVCFYGGFYPRKHIQLSDVVITSEDSSEIVLHHGVEVRNFILFELYRYDTVTMESHNRQIEDDSESMMGFSVTPVTVTHYNKAFGTKTYRSYIDTAVSSVIESVRHDTAKLVNGWTDQLKKIVNFSS